MDAAKPPAAVLTSFSLLFLQAPNHQGGRPRRTYRRQVSKIMCRSCMRVAVGAGYRERSMSPALQQECIGTAAVAGVAAASPILLLATLAICAGRTPCKLLASLVLICLSSTGHRLSPGCPTCQSLWLLLAYEFRQQQHHNPHYVLLLLSCFAGPLPSTLRQVGRQ